MNGNLLITFTQDYETYDDEDDEDEYEYEEVIVEEVEEVTDGRQLEERQSGDGQVNG